MEPVRRPLARHHHQQRQQALPPARDDAREEEEEDYDDDDAGDVWPPRTPSSARRYQAMTTEDVPRRTAAGAGARSTSQSPVPRRSSAPAPTRQQQRYPLQAAAAHWEQEEDAPVSGSARRVHWLVVAGLVMGSMLIGWVLLTLLSTWWQVALDDWRYGRPRTYQMDAVVGHHDAVGNPSHYLALNLNSHVEVIELPGGDASKAKIYLGPTLIGPGQDLAVVTLTFKDVNGDGKPDMIVNVEGSHFIFINENGQFRPLKAGEQVNP